jgi:hypothetical protein
VHFIGGGSVPQADRTPGYEDVGSSLIADVRCPTRDLWLHGNVYRGGYEVGRHSHSEDEIILVTSGEIVLGARHYGPDTAIAVAKNTIYSLHLRSGWHELRELSRRFADDTPRCASQLSNSGQTA